MPIFRLPTFNQVVDVLTYNAETTEYEVRLADQECAHYAGWRTASQVWHQPGYNPLTEFQGGPVYVFFRFPKGTLVYDKNAEDLPLPDVIRWDHEDFGTRYYRVDQVEPRWAGFVNEHVQCSCSLVPASAVLGAATPPPPPGDPISESLSTLVATPTTQDADGESEVTLTLTLVKESGSPATGQGGAWVTDGSSVLEDATFVTNSAGQATTTATNTVNEECIYEANPTHLAANVISNAVTWENSANPLGNDSELFAAVTGVGDGTCEECEDWNTVFTLVGGGSPPHTIWAGNYPAPTCYSGAETDFTLVYDPETEQLGLTVSISASGGVWVFEGSLSSWDGESPITLTANPSATFPDGVCDWPATLDILISF